jgi:hypothetical protein
MNRVRIIIAFFILFCLFPRLSAAKEISNIIGDSFEEVSGIGLEIRTNPSAVKVFIDGAVRGNTPISFEKIALGEHQIKLSKDGYKDRVFNVVLFNTSKLVVSIEMEEEQCELRVSVSKAQGSPEQLPFKPGIYSGEHYYYLPSDNTILLKVPEGYRTIRAQAFGWEDASVTVLVEENKTASVDIIMRPAKLKVESSFVAGRIFNPKIPDNTAIFYFTVSAPALATFSVFDENGKCVYQDAEPFMLDRSGQRISWDGRDSSGNILPEGFYTLSIEAYMPQEFSHNEEHLKITGGTEISYSNFTFLSTDSVVSGLTFSPLPHTLPGGNSQFEAGFIFKDFRMPSANKEDGVISGMPFKISLRLAPFSKLELTTVFNINPLYENQAGCGFSSSVKLNFYNARTIPIVMSAAASYSWAGKNGEMPLSSGRGLGLYLPLSLELSKFSIAVCPAVFWRTREGITPEFLLSGGIMYNGGYPFSAGVSARSEFNFKDKEQKPKIFAGAQLYYYSFYNILYISLQGGMWKQGEHLGFYGGLMLGFFLIGNI